MLGEGIPESLQKKAERMCVLNESRRREEGVPEWEVT